MNSDEVRTCGPLERIVRLRDVLPREVHHGDWAGRAARYLDVAVIEEREFSWPGKHKNVIAWWVLANGYAVGWNENPAIGWSFPVIRYTKE